MIKNIFYINILILCLTILTGCSTAKNDETKTISHTETKPEENTELNNINKDSDIETMTSHYGHGPSPFPEDTIYIYEGEPLDIPYEFYGGKVDSEIGLMIFIDGIPQLFQLKNLNSENKYIHIQNIKAESTEKYMIELNPQTGKIGNQLKLNFVSIALPSYKENTEYLKSQYLSTTCSYTLLYKESPKDVELTKIYDNFSIKKLPENVKQEMNQGNAADSVKSTLKAVKLDDKIEFSFNIYTNRPGTYRTTIYLDNQPVKIADSTFMEFTLDNINEKYTTFEIESDEVKEYSTVYAITVDMLEAFDLYRIDVFKSDTSIVIQ